MITPTVYLSTNYEGFDHTLISDRNRINRLKGLAMQRVLGEIFKINGKNLKEEVSLQKIFDACDERVKKYYKVDRAFKIKLQLSNTLNVWKYFYERINAKDDIDYINHFPYFDSLTFLDQKNIEIEVSNKKINNYRCINLDCKGKFMGEDYPDGLKNCPTCKGTLKTFGSKSIAFKPEGKFENYEKLMEFLNKEEVISKKNFYESSLMRLDFYEIDINNIKQTIVYEAKNKELTEVGFSDYQSIVVYLKELFKIQSIMSSGILIYNGEFSNNFLMHLENYWSDYSNYIKPIHVFKFLESNNFLSTLTFNKIVLYSKKNKPEFRKFFPTSQYVYEFLKDENLYNKFEINLTKSNLGSKDGLYAFN